MTVSEIKHSKAKLRDTCNIKVTNIDDILEFAGEHRCATDTENMIDVRKLTSTVQAIKPQDIEEHFICIICQDIVDNPIKCSDCQKLYCFTCIAKWRV